MLDPQLGHREVLDVRSCQRRAAQQRAGRDQGIGLLESHAARAAVTAPAAAELGLLAADRCDRQRIQQFMRCGLLAPAHAGQNLLDGHRGDEHRTGGALESAADGGCAA